MKNSNALCIALHCIALHCIALHCIALHCIALHYYYIINVCLGTENNLINLGDDPDYDPDPRSGV